MIRFTQRLVWFGVLAAVVALMSPVAAEATDSCPDVLTHATRLVLVVAPTMSDVAATLRRFERASPDMAWAEIGKAQPAVVGKAGMGWGWPFASYARESEPAKREGDKRAPAGFYPIGRPFGLVPVAVDGFLKLEPEQSFCVDDVRSSYYGRIVPKALAGKGTSGESMWTVPLYRRGLLVDYPANRVAKTGSCVFIHIWRSPANGTAGCVALPEKSVETLQNWARPGSAVIGILPVAALDRFSSCLPGISPP